MVSKNNESSNSSNNIASTSNNSREKETLDNSVLANKGFQKLLEAINNNHGNLEQIPKAFIKTIENIKTRIMKTIIVLVGILKVMKEQIMFLFTLKTFI